MRMLVCMGGGGGGGFGPGGKGVLGGAQHLHGFFFARVLVFAGV